MAADTGTLLALQAEDTSADRLAVQKARLAERAEAERLSAELRRGEAALAQATTDATSARREQDALENKLMALESKAASVADRLYGRAGVVSSPKELQALQADLEMINRQRSGAEDKVLHAMETRDRAVDIEQRTTEAVESLRSALANAEESLVEAEGLIDADIARVQGRAAEQRHGVPAPVLDIYDRLRANSELEGVAAAALLQGVCGGCQLRLSSAEYEDARKSDLLVRCESCRRILVLT